MKRRARLIILSTAVLIAVVAIAGCASTPSSPSSSSLTRTYAAADGSFMLNYPSGWLKDEPQNGTLTVLFALPTLNASENLNVQLVGLLPNETLGTVTDHMTSAAHNYSDFQQIDANNTTLGGIPAYKSVYTATINGDQLKIMQVWTVKNATAFIITFKAAPNNYDTYEGTAQQMIDSFQLA